MSKLPDDPITAYDYVKDTLGAATSRCVTILNKEEAKNLPNQEIIDKYENELSKIFFLERELAPSKPERMQEIRDEYSKFLMDNPS